MDDYLARVAIDFGGRNWLVWDASFKREKIGDVPTEIVLSLFQIFQRCGKMQSEYSGRQGTMNITKLKLFLKPFRKLLKWR